MKTTRGRASLPKIERLLCAFITDAFINGGMYRVRLAWHPDKWKGAHGDAPGYVSHHIHGLRRVERTDRVARGTNIPLAKCSRPVL
jgi:hypothetical protein